MHARVTLKFLEDPNLMFQFQSMTNLVVWSGTLVLWLSQGCNGQFNLSLSLSDHEGRIRILK